MEEGTRVNRLSCLRMDARMIDFASARNLLCLAASILGLMVLAFAVAPGTVLASTGGVYKEERPPATPPKKEGGKKNAANENGGGNGNSSNPGSSDGDGSGAGSSGSDDGSGSGQSTKSKKYSDGKYNPATDSKKGKAGKDGQGEDDDSVVAAAPASGDDDGGSAWPLIIAIVIGVPLLGAGGYFLWKRYRGPDEETREQLKTAIGSKTADGSTGKTGS